MVVVSAITVTTHGPLTIVELPGIYRNVAPSDDRLMVELVLTSAIQHEEQARWRGYLRGFDIDNNRSRA